MSTVDGWSWGRVRLPDRRWMQYVDTGPTTAPVAVYCHGIPGSRQEIGWAAPLLARSGVRMRLIALNRPGYGQSTWDPRSSFRSWANDAAKALDILGVHSCAVLGASGGAPYALAFAAASGHRVSRIGLAAGVGPPAVGGMRQSTVWLSEPRSARLRRLRYAALAVGYRAGLSTWLEERILAGLGEPDRSALATGQARSVLHQVAGEAFAQRGRAAAHEAGLLLRPWDLDLTYLDRPVGIWHGSLDTRVPVDVASGLAELLPHASLTIWTGHGHFSWAADDAVTEIATWLTQPSE